MQTIVCLHCGRKVISNKKLKHLSQRYCGSKQCQSSRKLNFERDKYKNDGLYRSLKKEKSRERKKHKASQGNPQYFSQYQRAYRASHPEYVIRNREKQRQRYAHKRDKTTVTTKIVNPDTLMPEPSDNEQIYAMYAIDARKIVNPDTIMLEWADKLSLTDKKPLFVRLL